MIICYNRRIIRATPEQVWAAAVQAKYLTDWLDIPVGDKGLLTEGREFPVQALREELVTIMIAS